jgi:hypothetical protein
MPTVPFLGVSMLAPSLALLGSSQNQRLSLRRDFIPIDRLARCKVRQAKPDLHSDAVQVEGADRGRDDEFPAVKFEHFHGVTPRRYRELFERDKRKGADGKFVAYINGAPAPIVDLKTPFLRPDGGHSGERSRGAVQEKFGWFAIWFADLEP